MKRLASDTIGPLRTSISVTLFICLSSCVSVAQYPQKPIKVVVPFAPGGGSDTFVRIVQGVVHERKLLPQSLVVINVPGAGGTIGSRRAKNALADGYTILNLHDGILSAKYAGQTVYGPEAFEPIAATGRSGSMVCVVEGSKWKDLRQVLEAACDKPNKVTFGANLGALSHFAGLQLEHAFEGASFRYVPSGGGARRFGDLIGGHVDVSVFSTAEYAQFKNGGLKAIAILSEQRHPVFADVPTAREAGADVVWDLTQFWWAPKGTPPERVDRLARMLRQVMQSPTMKQQLEDLIMDPVFLTGNPLRDEIARREAVVAAVRVGAPAQLPDTPLLAIVATVLLGGWAAVVGRRRSVAERPASTGRVSRQLATFAVLTIFCLLFSLEDIPFWLLNSAFIAVLGLLLLQHNRRMLTTLAATAIVIGPGCHLLFTKVLVIDLP